MTHDPMCVEGWFTPDDGITCICDLIAKVRAGERERAVQILAAMHPISQKPEHNSCHWRDKDAPDQYVCVPCSDFEYTYEPWPCDELRDFVEALGFTGDLRQFAVHEVLDQETKQWVMIPATA